MAKQFDQIQNIVIVLQENHTFDCYFGTYPKADGTTGKSICLPTIQGGSNYISPFHLTNLAPPDIDHGWPAAHADYDGRKMDGFVYTEKNNEIVGYYDRTDLPHYWAAADNYVLCQRFFTSVMSQSAPNHLHLVAGTSGGIIDNKVPKTLTFPPIFQQLDRNKITWKVYGFATWYKSFEYVQKSSSAAKNFATAATFAKDLSSGNLPQISWIIGAPGGDEHSPKNIQAGENSVANDIVSNVGKSKY